MAAPSSPAFPRPGIPLIAVCGLATMLATAPFLVQTARTLLGHEATTVLEWVSPRFAPRAEYTAFMQRFGTGSLAVVTWPGCRLDTAAVPRLAAACVGPQRPCDAAGRPWFDSAISGPTVLDRLAAPPLELDREEVVRRLDGVLVGPDGRTTCIVVAFTPAGVADRRSAVAWLRETAVRIANIPPADLRLGGPVIDTVEVDTRNREMLSGIAPWAALVIFVLTWISLRSLGYASLVFFVAAWSIGLSFLTMRACGDRMSPLLVVMPVLVLVLGVSAGIHLVNYLDEARAAGPDRIAARAIRLGFLPCLLSAGTTAIGLASLVVSDLGPIRAFGFHGAVGVISSLAVGLLVLPGLYERWPPRRLPAARGGAALWNGLAGIAIRRARPIVAFCFGAMLLAGMGAPGLRTSIRLDRMFAAGSRLIRDYRWIEDHVGPMVPIEVVVAFDPDSDVRVAERVELVRAIASRMALMPGVHGVLSAATFLPDGDAVGAVRIAARRVIVARRLAAQLSAIDDLQYVQADAGAELWRLTARASVLGDIDYGDFLEQIRATVAPVIDAAGGAGRGVSLSCTGVMPVVLAIQKALQADLFVSFFSALALITVVMMVVEGGVAAGVVAMVSNLFPIVIVFGLLGWCRDRLDIGSVMTASIALGMAIDGTLHFLTFYRRSRDEGADAEESVRAASSHCAAAMTQSTLACGLGLLLFAASSYLPAQRFAMRLVCLMALALTADLVLLPAMLVGPLGRAFPPVRKARTRGATG